jgi:hypothetical protein
MIDDAFPPCLERDVTIVYGPEAQRQAVPDVEAFLQTALRLTR